MIIPLLCIYAFEITSNLTNISTSLFTKPVKQYPLELLFALVTILFGIYTTYYYLHDYAQDSTVPDVSKIVKLIQSEKPDYLFGSVEVTPAFSYLANVPPLGNIADTNDVLFATGVLNKDKLNIKAYTTKTIIISKGVYYPGKIIQPVDASIFDVNILSSCVILGSFPVEGGDFVNRLNIIKCYK